MKRYSIMGWEVGADREVEICQCDTNPVAMKAALEAKTRIVRAEDGRRMQMTRYDRVRIIDNQEGRP